MTYLHVIGGWGRLNQKSVLRLREDLQLRQWVQLPLAIPQR